MIAATKSSSTNARASAFVCLAAQESSQKNCFILSLLRLFYTIFRLCQGFFLSFLIFFVDYFRVSGIFSFGDMSRILSFLSF